MAASDSRPVPIKNTAYRVIFPILDADGDLVTGATGLDSEVSKDCGTFADCTNEATEIATSSGMYYLDLTSTEMNADSVAVIVKTSSSGAKTTPIVLYPQESGDIKVDVQSYGGTAGTFSGGRPEVNTTHAAGTAWASGAIVAGALATGAITSAKFAAGAIDAAAIADNAIDAGAIAADAITAAKIADGAIDLATFAADAKALMGVIAFGTAQSVTGTTIRLASAETFADDEIIGATVIIRSATTGAGQARVITDYVSSTDTATVDTWTTTPTGTITYVVIATAPGSSTLPVTANVTQWAGSAVATPSVAGVPEVDVTHNNGTAITAASGIQEVKVASIAANAITATAIASDAITDAKVASDVTIASVTGAVGSVTGNVGGNVVGSVGSVTGAVGSVTGNVGGNVTGSVGSVAAGGITASSIATGAIDADALATDAVTEIADGVLNRDMSAVSDTNARSPLNALRFLRNKWDVSSTTLTVKKEDDSTTAWTGTVTAAPGADPISGNDPA